MQRYFKLESFYPLLIAVCVLVFSFSKFWNHSRVIDWDMTLYYSYLPALFIYDDIKFEKPVKEWGEKHFYMSSDAEGNKYVKMTSGLAILYSPFFFAAHAVALMSDTYEANGFSSPYPFALLLAVLSYTLLGLWFLKSFLSEYVSKGIASLSVVLIYAGTNLPYYSFVEPMSHAFNFSLICFMLWLFQAYRKQAKLGLAIALGLVGGLLILIRPTNVIALLFPLILLIWNKSLSPKQWWQHGFIVVAMIFLAISPQLFYWHHMTGNWVIYSYNDERFFFGDPEIWKGLFSYRKGWFVYSPILWLSIPGFYWAWKKVQRETVVALAVLFLAIWVNFSWWCWWYGGGFGARSMIDYLPFMAIALAFTLQWLLQQSKAIKLTSAVILTFITTWSIFMNKQYKSGIIHYDSMSKELFWKQFFVDHYIKDYESYLDHPDYEAAKRGEEE